MNTGDNVRYTGPRVDLQGKVGVIVAGPVHYHVDGWHWVRFHGLAGSNHIPQRHLQRVPQVEGATS